MSGKEKGSEKRKVQMLFLVGYIYVYTFLEMLKYKDGLSTNQIHQFSLFCFAILIGR